MLNNPAGSCSTCPMQTYTQPVVDVVDDSNFNEKTQQETAKKEPSLHSFLTSQSVALANRGHIGLVSAQCIASIENC